MRYKNLGMKLDELIGYFKEGKINLSPPFQRGRVWNLKLRQKLVENIVRGKPIPAIFLYKQASGSMYLYNILDGKQRLESILLFVADGRTDMSVPNWKDYFFKSHDAARFKISVPVSPGDKPVLKAFAELDDGLVRDLREYAIPTIEIDLDDEDSSLDDIINLFIDINQLGVKVNRFDIVRTMYEKNALLASVFRLIGEKQTRGKDTFYKMKDTDFTRVLKRLNVVNSLSAKQERVDRMWERLLEITLFVRTDSHRTLAQILKAFLGGKVDKDKVTGAEMARLRHLFQAIGTAYRNPSLSASKLATDQTHFYTMVTSLHAGDLAATYPAATLTRKLVRMGKMIDGKAGSPAGHEAALKEYLELSAKQTTHIGRRQRRQELFVNLVNAV